MKLYAIIKNNIVIDGWMAYSKQEALNDNPGCEAIEVTIKNSPIYIGQKI
jgi:hypothetical protein